MKEAIANCTSVFAKDGYVILPGYFSSAETGALIALLEENGTFNYNIPNPAHQSLLVIKEIKELLHTTRLMQMVEDIIGLEPLVTGAIILDKTTTSNWGLDWHQDLYVAVKQRIDTPGYTGWTIEEGIPHVIMPRPMYGQKIYLRIHLDDSHNRNGAMWVLPGTHKLGIVEKHDIPQIVNEHTITVCEAMKGSIMLMHPLLLHKSPYSLSTESRRILQAGYTTALPGNGLEWHIG